MNFTEGVASGDVRQTLDHLFRRQSGGLVSALTRVFGPENLDLAETVVQDALLKAVRVWPIQGIPNNPAGWIMQVARNQALDILRRDKWVCHDSELLEKIENSSGETPELLACFESELRDDQLKLMFICCHPELSREARLALTLKTLCGFGVAEIARAFLSKEEAIAQRLVRAKRKIAELKPPFEVPEAVELRSRLDSVLEAIYLLFNEGYGAAQGESLIREDLCAEAIRLSKLLGEHPIGNLPKVNALIALLCFQASRLNARLDHDGDVLLLEDQDRSQWDQGLIAQGLEHLNRATGGDELTDFHLQAGIAACHALAPDFAATDWRTILGYYDELVLRSHSPVVALNRAVAVAMIEGPRAGISEIEKIRELTPMKTYYLVSATLADLYRRLGEHETATRYYKDALERVGTEPERRFLWRRFKECCGPSLNGTK